MVNFLFRAQDQNMTNGDFAFFMFSSSRSSTTDRPWVYAARYVDNPEDLPRRRRAFSALKQVLVFIRIHRVFTVLFRQPFVKFLSVFSCFWTRIVKLVRVLLVATFRKLASLKENQ